jgi:hypothetical protein
LIDYYFSRDALWDDIYDFVCFTRLARRPQDAGTTVNSTWRTFLDTFNGTHNVAIEVVVEAERVLLLPATQVARV